MLKIKKTDLPSFFNTISQSMPVYAPIRKNGITDYGFYDQTSQIDIDTLKTAKSPKDVFFPQSETMMKFCTDGKNITKCGATRAWFLLSLAKIRRKVAFVPCSA